MTAQDFLIRYEYDSTVGIRPEEAASVHSSHHLDSLNTAQDVKMAKHMDEYAHDLLPMSKP